MTTYERAKKLVEWLSPKERSDLVQELLSYPPCTKEQVMQMRLRGWQASDFLWDRKQYKEMSEYISASMKLSIGKDL